MSRKTCTRHLKINKTIIQNSLGKTFPKNIRAGWEWRKWWVAPACRQAGK